jgi:hypothetical protein
MLQLPVFILPGVFLVGVAILAFGIIILRRYGWDAIEAPFYSLLSVIFGGLVSVLILVLMAVSFFPYQGKYLVITQHSGTINSISNRFVDASGDVSDGVYVVKLDGDRTPYVVQDARVLSVKTGDKVDLACTLTYVYAGADRTDCYIASY